MGIPPPGQSHARQNMPGIVHKPQGNGNSKGPAKLKNAPVSIQPAHVYREQKCWLTPMQKCAPAGQKFILTACLRSAHARRGLRQGIHHRFETAPGESRAQFLVQQLPIVAGQQNWPGFTGASLILGCHGSTRPRSG